MVPLSLKTKVKCIAKSFFLFWHTNPRRVSIISVLISDETVFQLLYVSKIEKRKQPFMQKHFLFAMCIYIYFFILSETQWLLCFYNIYEIMLVVIDYISEKRCKLYMHSLYTPSKITCNCFRINQFSDIRTQLINGQHS